MSANKSWWRWWERKQGFDAISQFCIDLCEFDGGKTFMSQKEANAIKIW